MRGSVSLKLGGRLAVAFSVAAAACATCLWQAPVGFAGTANAGLPGASPSNPLAGMQWGTYQIPSQNPSIDAPSAFYNTARSQADQSQFAKLLAQPRFRWFGAWLSTYGRNGARDSASRYIQQVTGGNPDVGVQMATFRLQPFEHAACHRLPTAAEMADYRAWITEFAAGIGDSRVALDVQPDMPFTLCLPHHSAVDLNLIAWTVSTFSALAHTTVYIDAGAADWMPARRMATMLRRAGVSQARGFSLNLTHYDSTARQVAYGKKIVRALERQGVPGEHFVVNTAQNGRPFTTQAHRHAFNKAAVCATRSSASCVTLGQPPTTQTGSPVVDGFLWLGRPWINNATTRGYDEVLRLVTSSPFF